MIIIKLGPAIHKFQLPKNAKIYLVFNVALFYLANPDTLLQSTFRYKPKEKNEFEVE